MKTRVDKKASSNEVRRIFNSIQGFSLTTSPYQLFILQLHLSLIIKKSRREVQENVTDCTLLL